MVAARQECRLECGRASRECCVESANAVRDSHTDRALHPSQHVEAGIQRLYKLCNACREGWRACERDLNELSELEATIARLTVELDATVEQATAIERGLVAARKRKAEHDLAVFRTQREREFQEKDRKHGYVDRSRHRAPPANRPPVARGSPIPSHSTHTNRDDIADRSEHLSKLKAQHDAWVRQAQQKGENSLVSHAAEEIRAQLGQSSQPVHKSLKVRAIVRRNAIPFHPFSFSFR